MKTATVRELRNQYRRVLAWAEGGEEVEISRRGKVIARIVPPMPKTSVVDWSQSAAVKRDRRGWRKLTARESAAILSEGKGTY